MRIHRHSRRQALITAVFSSVMGFASGFIGPSAHAQSASVSATSSTPVPAPGPAPTPDPAINPGSNELRVDLGWASPVGELGVSYGRRVLPFLGLEAGIGEGFTGTQLSMLAKLRTTGDDFFGFLDGGASASIYKYDSSTPAEYNYWLNVEAGMERVWPSGLALSLAVGTTTLLPGSDHIGYDWLCIDECSAPGQGNARAGNTFLTARVGVGVVF
jgi:hypothetical protein